jgi:FKBP-type peptidyl-prolyl cis-trans isomerase
MARALLLTFVGLVAALGLGYVYRQRMMHSSNQTASTQTQGTAMTSEKIKLPSGLVYEIQQEGSGATPQNGNQVTVHYTGWLDKDGQPSTKFDSSRDRGTPFTFIIGKGMVIKGWDEGVLTMKIGEKRRLFIPANLAYGARGVPGVIPPNWR